MPLKLDVRKKLSSRSDRVKSIDLHPSEPWVCSSLYNGNVHIWNIESQQLIKTFEICAAPVRAVCFVARKNWIVTGSDDMYLRIFNYNTLDRVHQFEAHSDYIRSITVHPTQPFILTGSDDMFIRLWDWEKNWTCAQVFEGHSHYVMQLVINPKDNNTFASGSLDKTIKVWSLGAPQPNFTLEGHERGINCIGYHPSPDKPYLASGSDDRTVRIWDYQTKLCVQILEGHAQNVSSLSFHPDLPIIMTGSEDGTVRIWHSNTYRLESTLNYGLERVWAIVCHHGSQQVGIGYDEGTIVISLGREDPAMSMDATGKLVCARHAELVQTNIRSVTSSISNDSQENNFEDGSKLPIVYKDMGSCEIYPQTLAHNANGRFVVVCGDGEYIIYTAMALRNRMFGQAQEFVWSQADATMYAILENNTTVKLFKNFKEVKSFKMDFGADQIFGGFLLGVRSVAGFTFYDWQTGRLLRRIDVSPKSVYWAESGQLVAICTKTCFYILKFHSELIAEAESAGTINADPDGVEAAFEVIASGEVKESVKTGCWFGDAFLFTNSTNRLMYYVGGELVTVAHLDRSMYLLGYLASENHVYLGDKDLNVVGYTLLLSVLEYETAVLRRDFTVADSILPKIPIQHRTKIANFLEKQGFRQQAMRVTTDPEHKFDLALQLNDLTTAYDLIKDNEDVEFNENKWRQLADIAVKECDFKLAQECFSKTQDHASFLLIATSSGDADMIRRLAADSTNTDIDNLTFLSRFLLSDLDGCLELLVKSQRYPEATFFAKTYLPSKVPELVELWRKWLLTEHKSTKTAESLANPNEYSNLFPGWNTALEVQKWLQSDCFKRQQLSASIYPMQKLNWERNLLDEFSALSPAKTEGNLEEQSAVQLDPFLFPSTNETVLESAKTNVNPDSLIDLSNQLSPSGVHFQCDKKADCEEPVNEDDYLIPTDPNFDSQESNIPQADFLSESNSLVQKVYDDVNSPILSPQSFVLSGAGEKQDFDDYKDVHDDQFVDKDDDFDAELERQLASFSLAQTDAPVVGSESAIHSQHKLQLWGNDEEDEDVDWLKNDADE